MVTTSNRMNGLAMCGVLAIGALTVGTAGAATLPIKYTGLNGSSTSVSVESWGYDSYNGRAGAMNFTQTNTQNGAPFGTSFTSYCIELDQSTSTSVQNYETNTNVAGLIGADDATAIGKLWYHYDAGGLTGDSATAFQLVVWNLVYDKASDFSLASGFFTADASNAVETIASNMLSWLKNDSASAPQATLTALVSDCYQDQIIGTGGVGSNPVPEPAALGVLALGSVAILGRRRLVR